MKRIKPLDELERLTRQDFIQSALYQLDDPAVIMWNRRPELVVMKRELYEQLLELLNKK